MGHLSLSFTGIGHRLDNNRYELIRIPLRWNLCLHSFQDKAAKGIVSIHSPGSENQPRKHALPQGVDKAFFRLFQSVPFLEYLPPYLLQTISFNSASFSLSMGNGYNFHQTGIDAFYDPRGLCFLWVRCQTPFPLQKRVDVPALGSELFHTEKNVGRKGISCVGFGFR